MSTLDKKYTIKIDTKSNFFNLIPNFSISDNETSDFSIRITNRNRIINLQDVIVLMVTINPNGEIYSDFVEVESAEEGLLYCNLKQSFKNITGVWNSRLMLIYENEKVVTGTFSYKVNTDEFIQLNEQVIPDDRFPVLTELISRLSQIEIQENNRQEAEAGRVKAEEQREISKQQLIDQINKLISDTNLKVNNSLLENSNKIDKLINDTEIKIDNYKTEKDLEIDQDLELYKTNTTQNIENYKNAKNTEINQDLETYKTSTTKNIEDYKVAKDTQINQSLSTYENTINTLKEDFNEAVSNVTNGNESATNTEIVLARKGEKSLRDKIDKIDEQYNTIEQNIYEKANSTTFAGKVRKQKKAIVTFIDDDGLSQKQIPLFQTRNMKCCLALTKKFLEESKIKTQYMTIEKALELQNNFGWEICTHGENHLELDKLSEQEVDNEILNCYNYLTKNGFKVNAHVYAYGYSTEYSRNVTRKNHIVGINATPNLQKTINNIPISTFRLGRVPLGWGTETGKDTLEYYKSLVDKCVDENGWLVFMCHLAMTSDEQITIIGQLLDYIQTRSNDISVQTVTEAIKTFGNQIDIGDFEKFDDKDNSYHIVSADGKIYNSSSKYFTMHHLVIKKETPISEFPYGVTTVGFSSVDNTNFPSGGHIMTYRGRIYVDDLSFQMYFRYDTKGVEIRYWNDTTKTWGEFQTISGGGASNTVVKSYNSATPATPLQDFENGKITIVPITSSFASSNGFPTTLGGVLIVDRLVNDISFNTSEYKSVTGNTFIYRRFATSSTTWGAFNKIDSTKFTYLQDVVVGDIGINGTKDVKVTVDGVRDGDLLFVYPQWTLEAGITFNFWVSANNEITIRLSNNFSSIVNVATRKWNLGYVKVK